MAISYSYRDGLELQSRRFLTDGSQETNEAVIPHERLIFPVDVEGAQRRVQVALETMEVSRGNGVLEHSLLRGQGGAVTVLGPGWGCDFNSPMARRDLVAYAAADPQMNYVFYQAPGVGASSLPSSALRELASKGHFVPAGHYLLDHLGPRLREFDAVDLTGDSLGARYSIGLAAASHERNQRVRDLRVVDPVGSRDQSLLRLARDFLQKEGGHSAAYTAASEDNESLELQSSQDTPVKTALKFLRYLLKGGFGQLRAMTYGTLDRDLRQALPAVKRLLQVTSPEGSEITDVKAVSRLLKGLAKTPERPMRIEERLMKGRTHSWHSANPQVLAAVMMGDF